MWYLYQSFRVKRLNNRTRNSILLSVYLGNPWYKWFVSWSHAISHLGHWLLHSSLRVIKPQPRFKLCNISYICVYHFIVLSFCLLSGIEIIKRSKKRMHPCYNKYNVTFVFIYFNIVSSPMKNCQSNMNADWYYRNVNKQAKGIVIISKTRGQCLGLWCLAPLSTIFHRPSASHW
jgi:hypothetical protein